MGFCAALSGGLPSMHNSSTSQALPLPGDGRDGRVTTAHVNTSLTASRMSSKSSSVNPDSAASDAAIRRTVEANAWSAGTRSRARGAATGRTGQCDSARPGPLPNEWSSEVIRVFPFEVNGVKREAGGHQIDSPGHVLLKESLMEYGIGGILLLVLIILAIIYFAKRV